MLQLKPIFQEPCMKTTSVMAIEKDFGYFQKNILLSASLDKYPKHFEPSDQCTVQVSRHFTKSIIVERCIQCMRGIFNNFIGRVIYVSIVLNAG